LVDAADEVLGLDCGAGAPASAAETITGGAALALACECLSKMSSVLTFWT